LRTSGAHLIRHGFDWFRLSQWHILRIGTPFFFSLLYYNPFGSGFVE
jgi:hypothetical protein